MHFRLNRGRSSWMGLRSSVAHDSSKIDAAENRDFFGTDFDGPGLSPAVDTFFKSDFMTPPPTYPPEADDRFGPDSCRGRQVVG